LKFQRFDMSKVFAHSTHLMASEGKEYDVEEEFQGTVSFWTQGNYLIFNLIVGIVGAGIAIGCRLDG
jgi:hypothetical protein